jgi:hypothetical protein
MFYNETGMEGKAITETEVKFWIGLIDPDSRSVPQPLPYTILNTVNNRVIDIRDILKTGSAPEKLVRYVKGEEPYGYEIHDTFASVRMNLNSSSRLFDRKPSQHTWRGVSADLTGLAGVKKRHIET